MAKSVVVAVMDRAVMAYGRPVFYPSLGMAVRQFSDEVKRVGSAEAPNPMNQHPADFELAYLADFDDETGIFDAPVGGSRVVLRAVEVGVKE